MKLHKLVCLAWAVLAALPGTVSAQAKDIDGNNVTAAGTLVNWTQVRTTDAGVLPHLGSFSKASDGTALATARPNS